MFNVTFNESVEGNSSHINETVLSVKVKRDGAYLSQDELVWNCTAFTNNSLEIQLKFENPLDVSSSDNDTVEVKFFDPDIFIADGGRRI